MFSNLQKIWSLSTISILDKLIIFLIKLVMLPLEKPFCHELEKACKEKLLLFFCFKIYMEKRKMEEEKQTGAARKRERSPPASFVLQTSLSQCWFHILHMIYPCFLIKAREQNYKVQHCHHHKAICKWGSWNKLEKERPGQIRPHEGNVFVILLLFTLNSSEMGLEFLQSAVLWLM